MDFRLPEIGEGVYEAELVAWLVKPGDTVKRGQPLMEVMTDKATMEVPAPFVGTITGVHGAAGDQLKVGSVVLSYSGVGEDAPPSPAVGQAEPRELNVAASKAGRTVNGNPLPPTPSRTAGSVKAAPSIRQLARKLGIDLSRITGSGPEGRILIDDLSPTTAAPVADKRPTEQPPDFGRAGTRIKLQGLRRKIAERMVHSKRTIPHYTYVDECDATEMTRLREQLREPLSRQGVKLTYLAFFVKATIAALKEVPIVNATLEEADGEIILHDRYHIGIAVATPNGLMVPVIHDADRKDLIQIARDIDRLSTAARTGKVKLDELRGGTFTVTSIGGIGGLFATPVINHPEVGILGVGKIVKRPVFDAAGQVRPADMVYLSLSFDHRVVDGAVGAAFGNALIKQLQAPARLLLPEPV